MHIKLDQGPLKKWTKHSIKFYIAAFPHRKEIKLYSPKLHIFIYPLRGQTWALYDIWPLKTNSKKGMIPNVHKGIANVKFDRPLIFDMLC